MTVAELEIDTECVYISSIVLVHKGIYMSNEMALTKILPPDFDHLPTLKRWMMNAFAKIHHGTLFVHLDGQCYACGNDDSMVAHLYIHQPLKMAWRCISKGDLGFAEAHIEGHWTSDDLTQLLKLFLKNRSKLGNSYGGKSVLRTAANYYHKLRKNTLKGSRKNIQYHYDLGNDFYELWLDKSMTYSSALFDSTSSENRDSLQSEATNYNQSLLKAQDNKYLRILSELGDELNADNLATADTSNKTILEVGFGWGGFAEKALEKGYKVDGITLSDEQLAYAQTRLENYESDLNLEIKDYRKVDQQYDHIVSIEMFEAVGEQYWQTYFEMLKRSLKPGGKIVLQIITIKDEFYELYQRRADFIQRYIFPGGMLPSDNILNQLIDNNQLKTTSRLSFGHDYGETLARWEYKFIDALPKLEPLGYDKKFQRMWLYYLGYCQAGFAEERIDVIQLTLEHAE